MYVATGWLANERSQSLLLIGEPSTGKTELLHRFAANSALYYVSDMSVTGLHRALRLVKAGTVTHIVATEFQKFFMRRSDAVTNLLGSLSQAMDEGLGIIDVGSDPKNMKGAKIGLIGAMTPESYKEQERFLRRLGFLSRLTAIPWTMRADEVFSVMTAIGDGNMDDLMDVLLPVPETRIHVDLPAPLSRQFQKFVWDQFRADTVLRLFKRFRALSMACAALAGRDVVHARDVEKVVSFSCYWSIMYKG